MKNKIALITGASRGLGFQVSKLLAQKKIHVLGLGKTIGALETLSDAITELKGTSTMIPIDLLNEDEVDQLANKIYEKWGKIDIFIHCAGTSAPMSPVISVSLKDLEKLFIVNVRATLKLIQVVDPLLKISPVKTAIFVDDKKTGKFLSSYASSKSATREIIKSYREESKRIGPKVLTFYPEPMPTALRARFYPGENRDQLKSCTSQAKRLIFEAEL